MSHADGVGMVPRIDSAPRARTRPTWLATLLMLTAYSFGAIRPTPQRDGASGELTCSTWAWPALDVLGASAVGGVAALGNIGLGLCDPQPGRTCPQRLSPATEATLLIWAGALAASSAYGFVARGHCLQRLDAPRARGERALDDALRRGATAGSTGAAETSPPGSVSTLPASP